MMKLYERNCPTCGENSFNIVCKEKLPCNFHDVQFSCRENSGKYYFRQLRCLSCETIYSSPVVDEKILVDKYRKNYIDNQTLSKLAAKKNAEILKNHLHLCSNKDSAFELGAGQGFFLNELKELGFRKCLSDDPLNQGDFGSENNSFDLICCLHTIEHLFAPMRDFKKITGYLKKGGVLFVIFHNSDFGPHRLLGKYSPLYDLQHMQLYNARSFIKLMSGLGCTLTKIDSIENCYPLSYWSRLFPINIIHRMISLIKPLSDMKIKIKGGNSFAFFTKTQ